MITPVTESLRLSDFDFDLPESLIAQQPCSVRDRSRLMVLKRGTETMEHRNFSGIENYLIPGDLLVLNNTKVFPCRLPAIKPGGGKAEIFLLFERGINVWNALTKGETRTGKTLTIDSRISGEIIADNGDGTKDVRFYGSVDIKQELSKVGRTPLPPYIKREPSREDHERYQTVYAAHEGAVAAPTAGLHFTPDLLSRLKVKGIESAEITLHVGPGTFQPVKTEMVADHRMLPERYQISEQAAAAINRAKAEGRRVVAIGTTSVRTIESAAGRNNTVQSGAGSSELFVYPGYCFKITDAIITNFHLPKSTLLMLVAAFTGREQILSAYRTAVSEKYRFYSYGDAMMIL